MITVSSRVKCGNCYKAHGNATQRFGTGNEWIMQLKLHGEQQGCET